MANTLILKRSATPGKVPTTANLALGELGINTYDGKLYLKKDNGTPSIVEVGGATDHGALAGLGDDDHPQYLRNAQGTSVSVVTRGTAAPSGGADGDVYFQYT